MNNKEYGRGIKINMGEFINNNWHSVNELVGKEFKTNIFPLVGLKSLIENNKIDFDNINVKEFGKDIDVDGMNFDEFYDKYFGYKEQSTSVTDFYNKMKKQGLWDK